MKYNFLFGRDVKIGYLYSDTADLSSSDKRINDLYAYKHKKIVIPKMFIQLNNINDLININNEILKLPVVIKNSQKELIVFLEFEEKYYDVTDIIESTLNTKIDDLFPFSTNIVGYDIFTFNTDNINPKCPNTLTFKTRSDLEFFKLFYSVIKSKDNYSSEELNFVIKFNNITFNTVESFIKHIESLPSNN